MGNGATSPSQATSPPVPSAPSQTPPTTAAPSTASSPSTLLPAFPSPHQAADSPQAAAGTGGSPLAHSSFAGASPLMHAGEAEEPAAALPASPIAMVSPPGGMLALPTLSPSPPAPTRAHASALAGGLHPPSGEGNNAVAERVGQPHAPLAMTSATDTPEPSARRNGRVISPAGGCATTTAAATTSPVTAAPALAGPAATAAATTVVLPPDEAPLPPQQPARVLATTCTTGGAFLLFGGALSCTAAAAVSSPLTSAAEARAAPPPAPAPAPLLPQPLALAPSPLPMPVPPRAAATPGAAGWTPDDVDESAGRSDTQTVGAAGDAATDRDVDSSELTDKLEAMALSSNAGPMPTTPVPVLGDTAKLVGHAATATVGHGGRHGEAALTPVASVTAHESPSPSVDREGSEDSEDSGESGWLTDLSSAAPEHGGGGSGDTDAEPNKDGAAQGNASAAATHVGSPPSTHGGRPEISVATSDVASASHSGAGPRGLPIRPIVAAAAAHALVAGSPRTGGSPSCESLSLSPTSVDLGSARRSVPSAPITPPPPLGTGAGGVNATVTEALRSSGAIHGQRIHPPPADASPGGSDSGDEADSEKAVALPNPALPAVATATTPQSGAGVLSPALAASPPSTVLATAASRLAVSASMVVEVSGDGGIAPAEPPPRGSVGGDAAMLSSKAVETLEMHVPHSGRPVLAWAQEKGEGEMPTPHGDRGLATITDHTSSGGGHVLSAENTIGSFTATDELPAATTESSALVRSHNRPDQPSNIASQASASRRVPARVAHSARPRVAAGTAAPRPRPRSGPPIGSAASTGMAAARRRRRQTGTHAPSSDRSLLTRGPAVRAVGPSRAEPPPLFDLLAAEPLGAITPAAATAEGVAAHGEGRHGDAPSGSSAAIPADGDVVVLQWDDGDDSSGGGSANNSIHKSGEVADASSGHAGPATTTGRPSTTPPPNGDRTEAAASSSAIAAPVVPLGVDAHGAGDGDLAAMTAEAAALLRQLFPDAGAPPVTAAQPPPAPEWQRPPPLASSTPRALGVGTMHELPAHVMTAAIHSAGGGGGTRASAPAGSSRSSAVSPDEGSVSTSVTTSTKGSTAASTEGWAATTLGHMSLGGDVAAVAIAAATASPVGSGEAMTAVGGSGPSSHTSPSALSALRDESYDRGRPDVALPRTPPLRGLSQGGAYVRCARTMGVQR